MTHLLTILAFVCFFSAAIGIVWWLGWLTNTVLKLRDAEQEWEFELSPDDDYDEEGGEAGWAKVGLDEEFDIYSGLVELDLLLPDDEDRHL